MIGTAAPAETDGLPLAERTAERLAAPRASFLVLAAGPVVEGFLVPGLVFLFLPTEDLRSEKKATFLRNGA
jgi:hypothetical protein